VSVCPECMGSGWFVPVVVDPATGNLLSSVPVPCPNGCEPAEDEEVIEPTDPYEPDTGGSD
jgi:hypothetical protein